MATTQTSREQMEAKKTAIMQEMMDLINLRGVGAPLSTRFLQLEAVWGVALSLHLEIYRELGTLEDKGRMPANTAQDGRDYLRGVSAHWVRLTATVTGSANPPLTALAMGG